MRTFQQWFLLCIPAALLGLVACSRPAASQGSPQMAALPVQTATVAAAPVSQADDYVTTIKSRRSVTINPQVDGTLVSIAVHSGDHVTTGEVLMEIDPSKQQATVASTRGTEEQKLAVYQYNQVEVDRQRKLYQAGITSKESLDQAEQAFKNSQADYQSSVASTQTQQKQLGYYHITAPFDGIIGDVPVHLGDYVTPSTMLTTVDANRDLEAYIYIPAERSAEVRKGLAVDILDNQGNLLERTAIDFVSPQVDDQLQSILAKAPVRPDLSKLRSQQQIKARVIWKTALAPVVPVLAVTRLGGQAFVYVAEPQGPHYVAQQRAVTLGDTVGNDYAVLGGLKNGDKVIVSGIQFLVDGEPVQPLG